MPEEINGGEASDNSVEQPIQSKLAIVGDSAKVYNQLVEEREALHRMRVVSTMTLLAIFLSYMFFYYRLASNFDVNKTGSIFISQVKRMAPEISQKMGETMAKNQGKAHEQVMKAYRENVEKLRGRMFQQLKLARNNISRKLHNKMMFELERQIGNRTWQILKEFPELANDTDRELILERIKRIGKSSADRVISNDIADIRRSLSSIEITLGKPDVRSKINLYKTDPRIREKTIGYLLAIISRPLYQGAPQEHMGSLRTAE